MQYKVIRAKRKSMSINVNHIGEVLVRVPKFVRDADINAFVNRHRDWIDAQVMRRRAIPHFIDGECVPVCGQSFTIATAPTTKFAGETLFLPAEKREEALIKLLRKITRERMLRYLNAICEISDFTYGELKVTSARGRWGSCSSKRNISFTFRTAFLPDELAEYLAIHELCHTRYMNHSQQFWAEVQKFLPDYATRRAALKHYLWAMDCL